MFSDIHFPIMILILMCVTEMSNELQFLKLHYTQEKI